MEQLTDTSNYITSVLQNGYMRIFCAILYLVMFISGVTLYAMLHHNPDLVGLFVITLIFSPVATFCFWYVITHERYSEFEFNKKIAKIFNVIVFISIPLNHLLLLINSAIGYTHPNKIDTDAIAYTFVAFGWGAIGAVLLTIIGIQIYGIYLKISDFCKSYYAHYKSKCKVHVYGHCHHQNVMTYIDQTLFINVDGRVLVMEPV